MRRSRWVSLDGSLACPIDPQPEEGVVGGVRGVEIGPWLTRGTTAKSLARMIRGLGKWLARLVPHMGPSFTPCNRLHSDCLPPSESSRYRRDLAPFQIRRLGIVPNSIVLDPKVGALVKAARRRQRERRLIVAVVIVAAVVGAS
jgi:hypothetical protein